MAYDPNEAAELRRRVFPTRTRSAPLGACLAFALLTFAGEAAAADLVVGVPNWPTARATANLIKVIVEDRLGHSVELKDMESAAIFAGMDAGTVHVHPEAWLPNYSELTAEYVTKRGSVRESPHSVAASQNICTTRETADNLGVRSVADLAIPAKAALFDTDFDAKGEMWIGEKSWTSTRIEAVRARSYGYDRTMQLLEAPEEVAMATIDAAIAVGKPIVFYCYRPYYLFSLHDIVPLEEPAHDPAKWRIVSPDEDPDWLAKSEAGVAWDESRFQIDYATRLETELPDVARLLSAIALDAETVSAMSYALVIERTDPQALAKQWVAAHAADIDAWLAEDKP